MTTLMAISLSATGAMGQNYLGQWNFQNGDLTEASGGSELIAKGGANTTFGTTTTLGLPAIAGEVGTVLGIDKMVEGQGFELPLPVLSNPAGAQFLNNYTIITDILFPAGSVDKKRTILEVVDAANFGGADGAEFFVDANNGIGYGGLDGVGSVEADTWHRIAFVCDFNNKEVGLYIDGTRVGSAPIASDGAPDGRWAMDGGLRPTLFVDEFDASEAGFVSSIQVRDEALSSGQIAALAGPQAAGIPVEIPEIPSYLESWTPGGAFAPRDTNVGVVLNRGDKTLSSIVMTLDGSEVAATQSTSGNTISLDFDPEGDFAINSDHVLAVTYTESGDEGTAERSFEFEFTAVLFFEDFESIVLGPNQEENTAGEEVWSDVPPAGWEVDRTGVPGFDEPAENNGVKEWIGWSFADRDWWAAAAGDQRRTEFVKASGTVAVADPDEWDDAPHPDSAENGWYKTDMFTPEIALAGVSAGTAFIQFDSSWRPEFDSNYRQTGIITVSYDGGEEQQVMLWESDPASPNFKTDVPNETVSFPLNNPEGASTMKIRFGMYDAGNDWWWAIDNLVINAGSLPPSIVSSPSATTATEGDTVNFDVVAEGGEPFAYQWYFNGDPIDGATEATLSLSPVALTDDGEYYVTVSNDGGSVSSDAFRLIVLEKFGGAITDDLVVYLKFDGDTTDASGAGNDASPVGAVDFSEGAVGQAASANFNGDNYITLGTPADLDFGTDQDFTVSFWSKFSTHASDPAFISNKDWGSGGNAGWVIATSGGGRVQWNIGGDRKDYDGPDGTMNDGNWHHVVVSFDRGVVATTYLDGVQVNVTEITGTRDFTTSPALATNIGEDGTGNYNSADGPRFEDGMFDEVAIWRRIVTGEEVSIIYNSGLSGVGLDEAAGAIAGQWDFDNADLSPTVGGPIAYADGAGAATEAGTSFGSTSDFGISAIGGEDAAVMKFPAASGAMGFLAPVGGPNGGEDAAKKNQYTLIYDILWPADSSNKWRSFAQIDALDNSNDGEFFVNPSNGIGISGNYTGTILADTWHRVIFSVDQSEGANTISKYIDGQLVGVQGAGGFDGRWGLLSAVNLLSDDTPSEVQIGYVNSIQIRNEAISAIEALALGGPTAAGIPADQEIDISALPPVIETQPVGALLSPTGEIMLSVGAVGVNLSYQWFKDGTPIAGATDSTYTVASASAADAGLYRAEVTNGNGSVTSSEVMIDVFAGAITEDLVVYLPFDADLNDASGSGNNGTEVGSTPLVPGAIGNALSYSTTADGGRNYVTLGTPSDLDFGENVSFSLSFWTKFTGVASDPALIANKDWNSGGNAGWIVATAGDGRLQWNMGPNREDFDSAGGVLNDGNWSHVAITFDRNGSALTYLNGEVIDIEDISGLRDLNSGLPTNIGEDGTGTYNGENGSPGISDGMMDELGIWRRVLTQQEVEAIYAQGAAGVTLNNVEVGAVIGGDDITITGVSLSGTDLTVTWEGSAANYIVQTAPTVDGPWTAVLVTSETTATLPATAPQEFVRILGEVTLSGSLSGDNVTVPTGSAGTGSVTVVLDGLNANISISYEGLTGPATAAHIHGPAAAGTNAGVALDLAPYHVGDFAAAGTFSGTVELDLASINALLNELFYVNIHTAAHGGGEIRAQIEN